MNHQVPGITRQVEFNLPQSEDSNANDKDLEEGNHRPQEAEGNEHNQTQQHDENVCFQSQLDETSSNINQHAEHCSVRAEHLIDDALVQSTENEMFGSTDGNISDHTGEDFDFHLPEKFLTSYRPLFKIDEVYRESDDSDNEEEMINKKGKTEIGSEAKCRRRRRPIGSNKWSTEANYDSDESYDWLSSLSMSDAENKELENDPDIDEKRKLSIAAGVDYDKIYQEEKSSSDNTDPSTDEAFDDDDSEFKLPCNGIRQHDTNKALIFDMDKYHETQGIRIVESANEYPINEGSTSSDGSEQPNKCENPERTEINPLPHLEEVVVQSIDKTGTFDVFATGSGDAYDDDFSESCSSFSDGFMSNEEMDYYNRSYFAIVKVKKSVLSNKKKTDKSPTRLINKVDSENTAEMKCIDDAVDESSNDRHIGIDEMRESATRTLYRHAPECEDGFKKSDEGIENIEDDKPHSTPTSEDFIETNHSENSNFSSPDNAQTVDDSIENSQENEDVFIDEEAAYCSDDFVNEDDIVSRENKKNLETHEPYFDLKIEYN